MRPIGLTALIVLLTGLGISIYATNELRTSISRSGDKRLLERAGQTTTLFTSVANTIQTVLATGSAVAEATNGSTSAFRRSVRRPLADTPLLTNAVLLDLAASRIKIVAVVGHSPVYLGNCDAACSAVVRRLDRSGRLDIVSSGTRHGTRTLGLASAARPGSRYAVYSEIAIPKVLAGFENGGLSYGFYLNRESPRSLVATNTTKTPIGGRRLVVPIRMGGQQGVLVFGYSESSSLSGSVGPWLVLATGALVSIALAFLIEGMRRRRDTAVRLVEELTAKNADLDASEQALRSAERRYRTLIEELPLVTYAVDDRASALYVSPQIEELLGWPVEDWYADRGFVEDCLHPDDRERVLDEKRRHGDLGDRFMSEYRLLTRDGTVRWVLDAATVDATGEESAPSSRGFMLDVTDRKEAALAQQLAEVELRAQSELNRHQALHDALTGLPNRTLFRDRIEQEIRRDRRKGEGLAVILIDLNRFKEVNDTLGHQSGDALLTGLADRLRASIREGDTVARLGGDEFGVLAPGVGSPAAALMLVSAIHEALTVPVCVEELDLEVSASAGIALFPDHGADVETLIRHADVALYRSKESHSSVVYRPDLDHYSPDRLRLLSGLRNAIAGGEIVVYYQPQASAGTGQICSVEALVRWQHPDLGLVMPDQFIPLAEHTDLIRPLTCYVLDTAVAQCRAWSDRGWEIGVAVNITGRDLLDGSFPDEVAECLSRHGVDPARLEVEITENTIFSDPTRAHKVLTLLSELGVRVAIDDFGAGYSSLAHLSRLPVDVLKIDKSFVLDMAESNSATAIVRSTIELGHNLGLQVIAEGVETETLRLQLIELRCDVVQGFVLAKALPAGEVERLFEPPAAESPGTGRDPVALRLQAAT